MPIPHARLRRAIHLAALAVVACHDPTVPQDALTVAVTPTPATVPADGASSIALVATVPAHATAEHRTVAFTTPVGQFAENGSKSLTVAANDSGVAHATLQAPLVATSVLVRVTASGLARDVPVTFTTAPPASIDVEAKDFALKAATGQETTVTATLRRPVGRPSPGVSVQFRAMTAKGDSIGRFLGATASDTAGRVTARFSVGATSYTGPVTITATVPAGQGTAPIEGRTIIDIVP